MNEFSNITAAILAGGASERMGRDKSSLTYRGRSFLDIAADAVSAFPERLLSAANTTTVPPGFRLIPDVLPGLGPLGGIHAVLEASKNDYVLVLACDMPKIETDLLRYLCAFVSPGFDAFVLEDRRGWPQSLCSVYRKSAAKIIGEQLLEGNAKVRSVFQHLRVQRIPLALSRFPDSVIMNINTPEDYLKLNADP